MSHVLRPARLLPLALVLGVLFAGCDRSPGTNPTAQPGDMTGAAGYVAAHAGDTVEVQLTADLSGFDARGKEMIALLVQASEQMDTLYWRQSYADRDGLLAKASDPAVREFVERNYGPWDRLNADTPFIDGIGPRPAGAAFYPADMTQAEFDASTLPDKASWYTLLRRDDAGKLITVPFHEAYRAELGPVAALLRRAADLSDDKAFASYLRLRADALLNDDYQASDMAWMDMKSNPVDIVIGPIETYEDALYGYKASYEGLVLIKDVGWSQKLARFATFLPELQRGLPVPDAYKAQMPGADADLNAYRAVHYGGNANVGAKTIAINLPNDEVVQLAKGTRRLQLENVMQAKFDHILVPIAKELIAQDQLAHVTFDAFFEDTMFHEVAHGLGIKNTLDGKGTVSAALKDYSSSFEEGKADVLGLYLITALSKKGELDPARLQDSYVTFLAGILRSVRFGAADSHARANMVRFNYFAERRAFARDPATGRYRVDFGRMEAAMNALSEELLTIQGDGDYARAKELTDRLGVVGPELAKDLERLGAAKIPVDIRFRQGLDVLGLAAPAAAPASVPDLATPST
ncbi:MAG: dipeptidyl-peptidase 3 family protein, partial [Arenimonas sp.]